MAPAIVSRIRIFVQVARGLLARTDPRHKRAALLQVVGLLTTGKHQRRIEKQKK